MLKKLTLILAAVTACASLFGQGAVNFNTQVVGTLARVYDVGVVGTGTTNGALLGLNFGAQLYGAAGDLADDSTLRGLGTRVNFRGGIQAGYVMVTGTNKWGETINPSVKVPGTVDADGSRLATLQLRAWDASFDTYEAALQGVGKSGKSNLIKVNTAFPPNTPPNLAGLQGFSLVVPEPSTIALSVLGVGALLALRRRK